MIGNCRNFIIQDIEFKDVNRDGIHVEGPAYDGLIRDIRGRTGDDMIALNAWDWTNSSLTFGSIYNVIVEDIKCDPGYLWSEMRLHPGNYVLPDGRTIECPVYNADRCQRKNTRLLDGRRHHGFVGFHRSFGYGNR